MALYFELDSACARGSDLPISLDNTRAAIFAKPQKLLGHKNIPEIIIN